MSWDQLKQARQSQKGSSLFIRLKDGEAIKGVFRGEPHGYYRKYPDNTEYNDWAEGRRLRFRVNFVVKEDGEYVAKIYEGSKTVSDQIIDCFEKYTIDCVYEIKRFGSGKDDTRYTVMLEKKLTKADLEKISKVPLKDITSGRSAKEPELPDVQEEIPF